MAINNLGVDTLVKQASSLPMEEQLLLMARLADNLRQKWHPAPPLRKWREIRGSASAPLVGEDAQKWVSRTRLEGDVQREQQWRHRS